eukprot:scpid58092/ scgid14488/ 
MPVCDYAVCVGVCVCGCAALRWRMHTHHTTAGCAAALLVHQENSRDEPAQWCAAAPALMKASQHWLASSCLLVLQPFSCTQYSNSTTVQAACHVTCTNRWRNIPPFVSSDPESCTYSVSDGRKATAPDLIFN